MCSEDWVSASWRVVLLLLVCAEAAVLAVLEVFFLLVRFDGSLLPDWGAWPFPVMIAVAVVSTPVLVMWAAALSDRVSAAAAPLLVWFFTIFGIAYFEPGSVNGVSFLLGDWRTLLLIAGGALPGAVAVSAAMARNAANRPGLYDTAGTQ
ncbi:hypothetical protein BBK82_09665 [Lentzea guizhouensis]|uniref:Uncharacterized protein n=1 Tax=Lentzea guizhouensis TaxID=1586287 RepID=A0A1B2HY40_9PSEU|nr:hypothetical protein BBK82_09665 [Lentzea guizhouensis]